MDENENADDTFFHLTDALFSRGFIALADGMLAANDDEMTAERRASMPRHPSARRRF
jgi:hypothetical protein